MNKNILSKMFSSSVQALYKWQKEKRPIVVFLEKYFSAEELEEFLETGKMKKLEIVKFFSVDELEKKLFKTDDEIKKDHITYLICYKK